MGIQNISTKSFEKLIQIQIKLKNLIKLILI